MLYYHLNHRVTITEDQAGYQVIITGPSMNKIYYALNVNVKDVLDSINEFTNKDVPNDTTQ